MKINILIVLLFCNISLFAQTNVGIGTTNPTEKLDVNGNINVQGTIKASGVAGQSNQVLMTNNQGNLMWGDVSQYKNFIGFIVTGNHTWTVPTGITKILVEAWGGGGGGTPGAGGGGGGYIQGQMLVDGGDVLLINVGNGGLSGASGQVSNVFIGSAQIIAFGGGGASGGSGGSAGQAGAGGGFIGAGPGVTFFGQNGEGGYPTVEKYEQNSATTFVRAVYSGNGGDAGNTRATGGKGSFQSFQAGTTNTIAVNFGSNPSVPGGGSANANIGANGMVIIRY